MNTVETVNIINLFFQGRIKTDIHGGMFGFVFILIDVSANATKSCNLTLSISITMHGINLVHMYVSSIVRVDVYDAKRWPCLSRSRGCSWRSRGE